MSLVSRYATWDCPEVSPTRTWPPDTAIMNEAALNETAGRHAARSALPARGAGWGQARGTTGQCERCSEWVGAAAHESERTGRLRRGHTEEAHALSWGLQPERGVRHRAR